MKSGMSTQITLENNGQSNSLYLRVLSLGSLAPSQTWVSKEGYDEVSVLTHWYHFYVGLFYLQSRPKTWVNDIELIHTTPTNIKQSCAIYTHAHTRVEEHYNATWCNQVFLPGKLYTLSQRYTGRDFGMGQLKTCLAFHYDEKSATRNASRISVSVPVRLGIVLSLNKHTGTSPSLILVLRRGLSTTSLSSSSLASL